MCWLGLHVAIKNKAGTCTSNWKLFTNHFFFFTYKKLPGQGYLGLYEISSNYSLNSLLSGNHIHVKACRSQQAIHHNCPTRQKFPTPVYHSRKLLCNRQEHTYKQKKNKSVDHGIRELEFFLTKTCGKVAFISQISLVLRILGIMTQQYPFRPFQMSQKITVI